MSWPISLRSVFGLGLSFSMPFEKFGAAVSFTIDAKRRDGSIPEMPTLSRSRPLNLQKRTNLIISRLRPKGGGRRGRSLPPVQLKWAVLVSPTAPRAAEVTPLTTQPSCLNSANNSGTRRATYSAGMITAKRLRRPGRRNDSSRTKECCLTRYAATHSFFERGPYWFPVRSSSPIS